MESVGILNNSLVGFARPLYFRNGFGPVPYNGIAISERIVNDTCYLMGYSFHIGNNVDDFIGIKTTVVRIRREPVRKYNNCCVIRRIAILIDLATNYHGNTGSVTQL